MRKALVTIQHTATEVANAPTVGLYYVRVSSRRRIPCIPQSWKHVATRSTPPHSHCACPAPGLLLEGMALRQPPRSCLAPSLQEHVRSSLPLVVASRQEATAVQEELQDALYASRGAEEFAATLSAVLPGVLARLGDGLARAYASAAAATAAARSDPDLAPGMLSSTLDLLKLRGAGAAGASLLRSAGGGAGATGGS